MNIVDEIPNMIAPGIPAVSALAMAPAPFPIPKTSEFLAEQSRDQYSRQLAPTVRTTGCNYSYNYNQFLIAVVTSNKQFRRSLQDHYRRTTHTCITPHDYPEPL